MSNTVLITGAGNGLGLEMALHLAGRGFQVFASHPDPAQAAQIEAAAAARRVRLQPLLLDVTDAESIAAAVAAAAGPSGRIDALVNNAGVSLRGYFEDCDDAEIRRVLDVNLFGAMAVTRAVLPLMRRARRGRIVFISSVGGQLASMARSAYCASKFALEGFAESLFQEVGPLGIAVSIVEPAIVRTERWGVNRGIARRAAEPESPYYAWFQRQEQLADALVRSSPTSPADVASTVARALSEARPRLRYVAGRRAALVLALRRYMPDRLFERLYFGAAIRHITRPTANDSGANNSGGGQLRRLIRAVGWRRALQAGAIRRLNQEIVGGYHLARVLTALLNVGLFDALAGQGRVDLAAFAEREGLRPEILSTLCDYLYASRFLDREGPYIRLSKRGRLALDGMRGSLDLLQGYDEVFGNLEPLLRGERRYGVDLVRRADYVAKGSGEVGKLLAFPLMAEALRRHGFRRVLDLGCGDGSFLIDLCQRLPEMRGYGVDIAPTAIAAGCRKVTELGLQGRIELMPGDIFELDGLAARLGDVQAITGVYVVHEFLGECGERLIELLSRLRAAFPGVPLVLCEVIAHSPDELRARPGPVKEIQLFHHLSNQRLASRAEWRGLFARAGYTHVEEDYLGFLRTAIFVAR